MARADIRAGKAFVELSLKNAAFMRGLRNAQQRLTAFGSGIARIGAGVSAAGLSIVGLAASAVRSFAKTGDELDKMSRRTGVSAAALAELGFAAEQSGQNLQTIENSIRKMQKTIGDAGLGLKTATDGFDAVGVSVKDLEGLSPDEQFQRIADGVAAIEDPTKRAHAAMQIFGSRQGTALLPMLEGMRELRQEARDLGLAPSQESVDNAAEVTDAINRVRRVIGATVFEIGAALAPAVLQALDAIKRIVLTAQAWVKQNRDLIITIVRVGLGLVAAGAAITAIGGGLIFAGFAAGAFATILSVIGGAIAFILSPLGLLLVGLAGLVAWFATSTTAGRNMVGQLQSFFGDLLSTARETFGGISDALRAGDLALAGRIAITGLQVAFLDGIVRLSESVGGALGDFSATIGTQIAAGDIAGAWDTMILGMSSAWNEFAEGIVSVFTVSARGILETTQQLLIALELTTVTIENLFVSMLSGIQNKLADFLISNLEIIKMVARLTGGEAFIAKIEKGRTPEEVNNLIRGLIVSKPEESATGSIALINKDFAALDAKLNAIDSRFNIATRDSRTALRQATGGGLDAGRNALSEARSELESLRNEAAEKAAAARAELAGRVGDAAGGELVAAGRASNLTDVFQSSAAAVAASGGAGASDRKETNKLLRETKRIQEEMERHLRAIERLGFIA